MKYDLDYKSDTIKPGKWNYNIGFGQTSDKWYKDWNKDYSKKEIGGIGIVRLLNFLGDKLSIKSLNLSAPT